MRSEKVKDIGGNAKVRNNDLVDIESPLEAPLYFWLRRRKSNRTSLVPGVSGDPEDTVSQSCILHLVFTSLMRLSKTAQVAMRVISYACILISHICKYPTNADCDPH